VLLSGKVRVYKLSPDGKEQTLHLFGPGEPFGEAPVFAGERFPAHASGLEDGQALYFPRAAFVELIRRCPALALGMLATLSRRLWTFTRLVEGLSLREVPGRLAAHLLFLSDKSGGADDLTLDIAKGQLASLLGTVPETLSRILAKMAAENLIALAGPRGIRLLDRPGLEGLASGERRLT